jgi:hypothetical protein
MTATLAAGGDAITLVRLMERLALAHHTEQVETALSMARLAHRHGRGDVAAAELAFATHLVAE